jgi:hypothetical protein
VPHVLTLDGTVNDYRVGHHQETIFTMEGVVEERRTLSAQKGRQGGVYAARIQAQLGFLYRMSNVGTAQRAVDPLAAAVEEEDVGV